MEEHTGRFSAFGKKSAGACFMLAATAYTVLPTLMCSFAMLGQQGFLEEGTVLGYKIIAYIAAGIFAAAAFLASCADGKEKLVYKLVRLPVNVLLPAFATVLLCMTDKLADAVVGRYISNMAENEALKSLVPTIVLVAALAAAGAVAATWLWFSAVCGLCVQGRGKSIVRGLTGLLKHPLHWLLWTVLFGLLLSATDIINLLISIFPIAIPLSFATNIMRLILVALAQAGLMYILVSDFVKHTVSWDEKFKAKNPGEADMQVQTGFGISKINFVCALAGAIGIALCVVLSAVKKEEYSAAELILTDIDDNLTYGSISLISGDAEAALYYYNRADSRIKAWKLYIDGAAQNSDKLQALSRENPEDVQLRYLAISAGGGAEELEEYIIKEKPHSSELKRLLLDYYSGISDRELSAKQKRYKNEILMECIAGEYFVRDILTVDDIGTRTQNFQKKLNSYHNIDYYCEVLRAICDTGYEGRVSGDIVSDVIRLAKENPDDISVQYLAGVYGASLLHDGASHYKDTISCLKRYDELYSADKKYTKKQIATEKLNTANLMIRCFGYEDALRLLDGVTGEEAFINEAKGLMLVCYERLGNYEQCGKLAEELKEKYKDKASVLYYYGISELKLGNSETSFNVLFELSDLILSENTAAEERHNAEVALFALIEFAVVRDTAGYTEFGYSYYSGLGEEDKARLAENEFLYSYMEAVNSCYVTQKFENALENVEKVLSIRGDLSQALYLKGAILYGSKDFEGAVKAYQASVSIEPDSATVWFALANAYDALEMYREAYDTCLKVSTLLPETDHGSDWYGVGIHNSWMKDRLKSKLEGN